MASTNKTTNYELSQFEGTDKPSWEADYNADMLSIDTNLKAVSDVADGASGSISTLADRVTAAEGNITTNANNIDALEARADALEAGETAADGRLDAIEAEQIVQNTAIESNTRLGYNLARPYDSASTYAVGAYVLFQNTLYKCTTAIATGEAFDPSKWLAIKATDEIAAAASESFSMYSNLQVGATFSIGSAGNVSNPTLDGVYIYNYEKVGKLRILNIRFGLRYTKLAAATTQANIQIDITNRGALDIPSFPENNRYFTVSAYCQNNGEIETYNTQIAFNSVIGGSDGFYLYISDNKGANQSVDIYVYANIIYGVE